MMRGEFEERTGFFPTLAQYEIIEKRYTGFVGDKDAFCAAVKENRDGIAESIQREADEAAWKARREQEQELLAKNRMIEDMKRHIEQLKKDLDRAEGWTAHEVSNMSQDRYDELHKSGREMSDSEAREYIVGEFGFIPGKVQIRREIPMYQIDKDHVKIRKNGTVSRPPVYGATDWLYIRFDVFCSGTTWQYEAVNGQLREYAD